MTVEIIKSSLRFVNIFQIDSMLKDKVKLSQIMLKGGIGYLHWKSC